MAFSTTDNEAKVVDEIRALFRAYIPESDAWRDPSFFGINSIVVGGAIWTVLNEARNGIDQRVNPQTAIGENLDRIAATPPLNLVRLAPTTATGFIRGDNLTLTVVAAGQTFELADGTAYTANTNAIVSGGVATIEVTAAITGTSSNAPVDEPIVTTIGGTFYSNGIFGGFDLECDDAFRRRIFAGYSATAFFGSTCSYTNAINGTRGVTRSWVIEDGGVPKILFLMEDKYRSGEPTTTDIAAIKEVFKDECMTSIFYCPQVCGAQSLTIAPELCWETPPDDICEIQDTMQDWLRANTDLGEGVTVGSIQHFLTDNFPHFGATVKCVTDYKGQCDGVYNVVELLGPC